MAKIKICGLTRIEDIYAVNEAGADFAGFVFAKNSRRYIRPDIAASLSARLSENIIPTGVFVNADYADDDAEFSEIFELFSAGVIKIAQLHGGEDEKLILRLKNIAVPVIQAIRFGRGDSPSSLSDYLMFDGALGGSGEIFDWSKIQKKFTDTKSNPVTGKPWFLAGGINEKNISAALALKPYGIDVSSGVETGGKKDSVKIISLVKLIKNMEK